MVRGRLGGSVIGVLEALGLPLETDSGSTPIVLPSLSHKHLPRLFRRCGFTRGAEIGVWKGEFSAALCAENPALRLLCVDPWLSYPEYRDSKNERGQEHFNAAYRIACDRLAPFACTVLRMFSHEAAAHVEDRSLDFVYLDGNHHVEAVLDDLTRWSTKVRSGGVICGHDYVVNPRKPFIQVVDAVHRFTAERAIAPWYVLGVGGTPSFLWVNP